MNQIPTYTIIIFVQLFIISIIALGYFFMKWRQAVQNNIHKITPETVPGTHSDNIVKPDARTYLFMEAKLTEGRYETLGFQDVDELSESDLIEKTILKLRTDFLLIEHELSKNLDERDEEFWLFTIKKLTALLREHNLYGAIKAQFLDDDTGIRDMFVDQTANIDQLREYINNVVKEKETAMHIGLVLDIIEGRQREMNDCLTIAEEQNDFLRNQIQQLCRPDEPNTSEQTESSNINTETTTPAPKSAPEPL